MKISERRSHEYYMRMALSLAQRGTGTTAPNPRVGCVVVKDGTIVGMGFHRYPGGPHAEVEALSEAGEMAEGATLYVNLEPCTHYGRTPPCCPLIVQSGIKRVFIATKDPFPKVQGKGIEYLSSRGLDVTVGILEKEARWLNRGFFKAYEERRPWITLKAASSLDGNVALEDGSSRWVTGQSSLKRAHLLRAETDAILVGIGTVLRDDPQLTVRMTDGRNPLKIVLDTNLRIPFDAKLFNEGMTLIVTSKDSPSQKVEELISRGVSVLQVPTDSGKLDIKELVFKLPSMEVNYLLVEGGPKILSSFFKAGLYDDMALFYAPKVMGKGIGMFSELSFADMSNVPQVKIKNVRRLGGDLSLEVDV